MLRLDSVNVNIQYTTATNIRFSLWWPTKFTGTDWLSITVLPIVKKSNNPMIVTRLESLNAVIALLTSVGITALRACGKTIKPIFEMGSFQLHLRLRTVLLELIANHLLCSLQNMLH